ncbi:MULTISPECIES: tyrosine-protein phosphatase [unclassified Streptomyces]|uniref:tyrosine-protein phosphatase n=1 Tax=unclassified Streptomyces TaxID=2593676 RepID=UPI002E2909DF|nr:tyrosine-protein phosphatase [Streptomyces sp. NBC_01429]
MSASPRSPAQAPRPAADAVNLRAVAPPGVVPGRIWRAGAGAVMDAGTADELTQRHGLRAVIDLRSPSERDRAGAPAELLAHGVRWTRTPLTGYPRDIVHLPRPTPDHYVRYYHAILMESTVGGVPALFEALASAADEPFLVCCHLGKDRTAVVVAALLALADVPDELIAEDYAASGTALGPLLDRFAHKWRAHGWTREDYVVHLSTPAVIMRTWLAELRQRHGGVRASLIRAGARPADLTALSAALTDPCADRPDDPPTGPSSGPRPSGTRGGDRP